MFKLCIFVALLALVQARPQNGGGAIAGMSPNPTQLQQLKTIAKSCILRKDLMAIFFELFTTPTTTFASVKSKMNEKLNEKGLTEASAFIQEIVETQKQKRLACLDCFSEKVTGDVELTNAINELREDLKSDDVTFDTRCSAFIGFVSKLGPEHKPKLHECFQKHSGGAGAPGNMGGRPGGAGGGGFMFGGPGGDAPGNGQMNGAGRSGQANGQMNGGGAGSQGQGGMSGPMKMPHTCDDMAEMMSKFAEKMQKFQCPEGNNAAAPAGAARDAPAFEPAPAPEN